MIGAQAPVGFIGLGAMGAPVATRLQQAGYDLIVYDSRAEAADALVAAGARRVDSPRAVADEAATVLVSLPLPGIVADVALGADGLIHGSAIRTYVDLSTTGPEVAAEVGAALAEASIATVDAPLSGGPAGARDGRLTVMVAGGQDQIDALEPLISSFAGRIFVVGDRAGQGQAAKVINNLMSATAIAITAEAMVLGVRAGLDPATLLEVVGASSGANNAAADKFPNQVLTRRFNHGFRLELMAKDVRLAVEEGSRLDVPMPLGNVVSELWNEADPAILGEDCTAFVRMYEEWGHVTIAPAT